MASYIQMGVFADITDYLKPGASWTSSTRAR
jgi:hypothetical protein